ncbi:MAG: cysteine--tRNA ligase [Peptococcaceae bacterium]|nr:cysteine--tRNA ligase [Peptococcaceae bacterium]
MIYNTLAHKKMPFVPLEEGKVKMYVCGPTTYNYIHLGNARPIVVFDTVRRYFSYIGYDVTYVSNFTDVDDKIINRANEEGKDPVALAAEYIDAYFEDTKALNVLPATVHPKVSEHIDDIIKFVQGLIDKGYAYALDNGDVYYSVRKFADYGALSGRDINDLLSGARVEVDDKKHDPLDFALWKSAKPGEPYWESPWGKGRPGWHIECSAMSAKYLGDTFDIHGGGQDLIFPHHENEIAQSCALHDAAMARYWMHNGFITINQEKMSKSKGNFFMLRDILARFDAQVVRFYLLSVQYRSPLDFDDEKIEVAGRGLERLKHAAEAIDQALPLAGDANDEAAETLRKKADAAKEAFCEAMDDDFNTALAIAALFDLAKDINVYLRGDKFDKESLALAKTILCDLAEVLGIALDEPAEAGADDLADKLMTLIIDIRKDARANKDFATADRIRDGLAEIGVILEDGKAGTTWHRE